MDAADFDLIPFPAKRDVPADSWRPPADIRMISADDHHMEMDDLFAKRLPARLRDRAPTFRRNPQTSVMEIEYKGRSLAPPGVGGVGYEHPGYWDRQARLQAMDAEGISASVLYHGALPSLNGFMTEDPELYVACMDVYNAWLIEELRPASDRLVGVAMCTAFLTPETAVAKVKTIKDLGYAALMMPSYPRGVRYNSRELDPVFAAIEESGLPLHFHVTAQQEFQGHGSLGANLNRNFSPFRPLLGQLIFSGVLERHPKLKVGFVECGIAWVAETIVSADKIFRSYYDLLRPKLAELPSYYWYNQCFATFMDDPIGLKLIDDIGVDNALWSLDFPHPESVFGYAGSVAKNVYDTIGHEKAKNVLGGNAARIYGI
jgi:predicted TIM-barrel fold metal-dependent hydrolase